MTSASTISGARHAKPRWRPDLYPGAFVARHLRAGVPRRAPHRGATAELSPRGRRQGLVVLSASVADARVLAISHGVDGPGPDHGDLSGALHEIPGGRGIASMGDRKVWAFMGDGEMDEPESLGAIALAAREHLDNLIFVVNCNLAAPRRPGARQRQDHPGTGGRLSRRRLERHQSDLGQQLGSAARPRQERPSAQADGRVRRRRIPGLQVARRRLRARASSSASIRNCSTWSPA